MRCDEREILFPVDVKIKMPVGSAGACWVAGQEIEVAVLVTETLRYIGGLPGDDFISVCTTCKQCFTRKLLVRRKVRKNFSFCIFRIPAGYHLRSIAGNVELCFYRERTHPKKEEDNREEIFIHKLVLYHHKDNKK